jgi:type II secretory pathway component PulF
MAFFARYLATLQKAGVDILKSLELATQSINNLVLQKQISKSRDDVEAGSLLSRTLKGNRFIPNMVIRMISIGEAAGTLPKQLEFVAQYYDEELERKISVALAMLEPILIILMAGIGLALVLAVLLPMYGMMDQIFGAYSGNVTM